MLSAIANGLDFWCVQTGHTSSGAMKSEPTSVTQLSLASTPRKVTVALSWDAPSVFQNCASANCKAQSTVSEPISETTATATHEQACAQCSTTVNADCKLLNKAAGT